MATAQLFSTDSVLTTLKAAVVGIPISIGWLIINRIRVGLDGGGAVLALALAVFSLFAWGYLARRFWGWK